MTVSVDARFTREFEAGEVLFREGEPDEHLYVIRTGRVRVTKKLAGRETTMVELTDGALVGELESVLDLPRSSTATALEPTRCIEVDATALEAMVAGSSEIAIRLIKELATQLGRRSDMLADRSGKDALVRFALAVALRASESGTPSGDGTWVAASAATIAQEAAIALTELGNILNRLERLRLIEPRGDGLLVADVPKLFRFVEYAHR